MWFVFYELVFFFKQKTAYEMRISDWSSDVCSSDLVVEVRLQHVLGCGDQRQAHHRVLGPLVEQRVHGIAAFARLARQMARHERRAQAIHHDHPMRPSVEEPQAVGHVRAGLAEDLALRETGAAVALAPPPLTIFRVMAQPTQTFPIYA